MIVFDELLNLDERLRGHARTVADIAGSMSVGVPGLPPEAQSVIDGLKGLAAQVEQGVDRLVEAAAEFGQTAADALRLDREWLELAWKALKGNVVPGEGANLPLWLSGRAMFTAGLARSFLLRNTVLPWWVKPAPALRPGSPLMPGVVNNRMIFGSRRPVHPLNQKLLDPLARGVKVGGGVVTTLEALRRRLKQGDSTLEASAGAAGESATVLACAARGAKVPGPWQVKVAGGLLGGALCTGPGRTVGDLAAAGVEGVNGFLDQHTPEPVKDAWGMAKEGIGDGLKKINPYDAAKKLPLIGR